MTTPALDQTPRHSADKRLPTLSRGPLPRRCGYCRESFTPRRRSDARYCSGACRFRAWELRMLEEATADQIPLIEKSPSEAPCPSTRPKPPTSRRRPQGAPDRLSDIGEARRRREDGMRHAGEHADRDLLEQWYAAFLAFCARHATVFCDDFLDHALEVEQLPKFREPRALGPIFQRAMRDELIEKTGSYRPSKRSNLSPKPVWRSLTYGGERE